MLCFSHFFYLIKINNKSFSINIIILQIDFSLWSLIWLFKANESIWIHIEFSNFDIFNFSKLREETFNNFLSPILWNVFDIQVASLFWLLVSKQISFLFIISLLFVKSMRHNKLEAFSNFFSIHFINSFLSTIRAVLRTFLFWIAITNKPEFSNLVLNKKTWTYVSKRSKQIFNVLLRFINWNILNVNIVYHLSRGFQDIFWNYFANLVIFNLASQSSFHRFRLFETHKSIISSWIVFINCNFSANNLSKLSKLFKKLLIVNLFSFWKLYKQIFIVKISSLHYFSIEGQSSTRFTIELKISHFVACHSKLFLVCDSHNGSVEIVLDPWPVYLRLNIKRKFT